MRAFLPCLACALLASIAGPAGAQSEPLRLDQVMADPDWIGNPVEALWWQLDGGALVYRQKRVGSTLRDLLSIDLASGAATRADAAGQAALDTAMPVFDREHQRALIVRAGDIVLRDLRDGSSRRLSATEIAESDPQFSADGMHAQWRAGNDWIAYDLRAGLARVVAQPRGEPDPSAVPEPDALRDDQLRLIATLARERQGRDAQRTEESGLRAADPGAAVAPIHLGSKRELGAAALAPDARWLLAASSDAEADKGRVGKMPRYVTESGYEDVEDVRTRVGRKPPGGQQLHLFDLHAGSVATIDLSSLPGIDRDPLADLRKKAGQKPLSGVRPVTIDAIRWRADGSRAAVLLRAIDNKDRWIATIDPSVGKLQPLHRLSDRAWINWDFNDFGWLADGSLWLLSEESGFSHLYLSRDLKKARALTSGHWDVSQPHASADGKHFWFTCNRADPGDYELCALDVASGNVRELTALDGVEDFVLSPDEQRIALRWSAPYIPAQAALLDADGGNLRRLTDTRSEAFKDRAWLAPQFVQVPSRHAAGHIAGKLYRPATLEAGRRYPVVLFVHGAGYLQNTWHRYPNYFREQMFHNLLVERGYLVLELDYRGSAGYGRDWRTAIYRQMGHPELEDYLDAIDWLVDTQQAARDKVGIYGGSYGGFMTFMALLRAPEAFVAGAALRPVSDWRMYNHEYTSNILNTPDIDPEAYRISSPIEYAQNLRGQLLIAHGMIDDNVFYQDSVRMAQRLIELKKGGWELASYPLERHGFVQPESWYDEYRRIFELFERTLQP